MTFPRPNLPSRCASRSGFTLVEILVVIAIIALLAGVALPAVTGALKKAKENAAVQTAHGLGLAEFQYANDNGGAYPGKTAAINPATTGDVFAELYPTYLNSGDALYIPGAKCTTKWTGQGKIDDTMNAWSMTFRDANYTGLNTNDPDNLPALFTAGYTATYPNTIGTPAAATATFTDAAHAPFGTDGTAVGYKDLSSVFINLTSNGGTVAAGKYTMTSASLMPQTTTYTQENP